ncbi:MAG: UDP-N-acetylmuramoyl-L-alanyl-D-glutamate--2,6-diaminopimelate ligase [Lachnospiraceae bacterium]|nr:UDP-N-acetylmuramoyl-L-alanyl-D-glutamate--2,6-diaminopimelate ligase [Lachnospiraceae bacterium]
MEERKRLSELLVGIPHRIVSGSEDITVTGVTSDNRKITGGEVFVCIAGTVVDGHSFIPQAVAAGASAVVVTKDVAVPEGVTVVRVEDDRKALALMAKEWFGRPSESLITIGITGTKGKTTTAYMIYNILNGVGIPCGLIGTVENIIGDRHISSAHSTPESIVIQEYMAQMRDAGCKAVVMEVSSQGLKMDRVHGITYDYGLFTNLEPDHIGGNEHPDFEDYRDCKKKLFRICKKGIFNADDSHFPEMINGCTCEVVTYGTSEGADYRMTETSLLNEPGKKGVAYRVEGRRNLAVEVDIPGRFNMFNSLAAVTLGCEMGIDVNKLLAVLKNVHVRGRVESVPVSDKFTVLLDYAHNGMALRSLLSTLREYQPKRLVCMFGCGGNRAKDRRYDMGEISSKMADFTIVTSDNPRFEEPEDIIRDILVGVAKGPGKYVTVPDRREAIAYALAHAKEGDCIVIAGKGHEDYQEIRGVKYPMDDRQMILEEAARLGLCGK